jgi:hypothetical protein
MTINAFKKHLPSVLLIIWFFSITIMIIFRAANLSMVHDESITYLYFVHNRGYLDILKNPNLPFDANNHLLNSFMIRFWTARFGVVEWAIRLNSVLSWPVFAASLLYILRLVFRRWALLLAMLVCCSPFFLLDFFSLARGYAPGLALATLALALSAACFFHVKLTVAQRRWLILSLGLASALAVWFNYSLAYLYAATMAGFTFFAWARQAQPFKFAKSLWLDYLCLIPGVLVFLRVLPKMRYLASTDQVFGGDGGFWQNTVMSLIVGYSVQPYPQFSLILQALLILIFFGSLFYIWRAQLYQPRRWSQLSTSDSLLLMSWSLLAVLFFIIKLQFHFSGVPYPSDRAALYFIPLFFLLSSLLVYNLSLQIKHNLPKYYQLFVGLVVFLSLALIASFLSVYQLDRTSIWPYDQHTKQAVALLEDLTSPLSKPDLYFKIANNWLFEPAMNFYILQHQLNHANHLGFVDRSGPDQDMFFYYLLLPQDQAVIDQRHLQIVQQFGQAVVASNPEALERFKQSSK